MAGLSKGWWKQRDSEYRTAFRSHVEQGLSPFKNPASLLFRQGKANKKQFKKRFKNLRQELVENETKWEKAVGYILTGAGINFIRQKEFPFPTRPRSRIVDFLLPDIFLAIEIDGAQHYTPAGRAKDARREAQFKDEYPQIKFLRYSNYEVDAEGFAERLQKDIREVRCAFEAQ